MNTISNFSNQVIEARTLAALNDPVNQTLAHSRTSKRYQQVTTSDVADLLQSQGFEHRNTHQARVINKAYTGFQKHALWFDSPYRVEGEGITQLMLVNDHRGFSSFRFYVGFFGMHCLNQLSWAENNCPAIKIRHSSQALEQISAAIGTLKESCKQTTSKVERLSRIKVNTAQEYRFAKIVVEELMSDIDAKDVFDLSALSIRRDADATGTAWALLNRVQENVFQGGIKYIKRSIDSKTLEPFDKVMRTRKVLSIDRRLHLNTFMFETLSDVLGGCNV